MVAVANSGRTVVKVFDSASGTMLHECRRGADRAIISSINFHRSGRVMAVASNHGTVHVFGMRKAGDQSPTAEDWVDASNRKSSMKFLSGLPKAGKYFGSEWSFATFRVPASRCIAGFGQEPNTVVVLCGDGSYHKARHDPEEGKDMQAVEFASFDQNAVANA
mmetsp:Transcript_88713/g.202918  ORF Transcript_88713/g.202918 Transcript_88713/m.202918 type:complete len:163 (+) Transcript_88713:3-491(+)